MHFCLCRPNFSSRWHCTSSRVTKYLTCTQSSGQNCMQSMRACIFENQNIQCSNIIELLCGNEINSVNNSAMRGGPQFQIVESGNHKAMLADTPKRWFKFANAHQIRCCIQHAFSLSSIQFSQVIPHQENMSVY